MWRERCLRVEEDKSFNPKYIRLPGGSGVVFPSHRFADLIKAPFRFDLFWDVKYCIRQCIHFLTLP
jgi:hypothetical protein